MKRDNRKKSTGSAIVPTALGIFFLLSAALDTADVGLILSVLLAIAVIAAVIGLALKMLKKSKKSGTDKVSAVKMRRRKEAALEDKPLSSRREEGVQYNPKTAEELFLRDKQRRLEQLEVFLKNGIVDKNEYNLLKKRYENYSYERN